MRSMVILYLICNNPYPHLCVKLRRRDKGSVDMFCTGQSTGIYTTTVYVNGTESSEFLWGNFCGTRVGALALAQEQAR